MSKVILCAAKKAEKPYVVKTSGVRVYSIEELCYCLKNQIDMLDESVIDRDMALFIRDELKMTERGTLLEQLILTKADLKSRLVVIFCSADYFDENEINEICREIDELSKMSTAGRAKRRADKYMLQGYYIDALREYKALTASNDVGALTPIEYGNVLHNIGVIEAKTTHYDTAANMFLEAYERNNSPLSLKAYFFALKFAHRESEYIGEALRLLDNSNMAQKLEEELAEASEKAELSGELDSIDRLKVLYQQGRTTEFDRLSGEIIASLKRNYRARALE